MKFSNIIKALISNFEKKPNQLAYKFISEGAVESITYGELYNKAIRVSSYLKTQNAVGQRVILLLPPGIEYIVSFFGCLMAGAIAVPTYPPSNHRRAQKIKSIISDSGAIYSIIKNLHAQNISEIQNYCINFEDMLSHNDIIDIDYDKNFEDIAFLQYTSGSTSEPKGVMVSHGNIIANVESLAKLHCDISNNIMCSWVPPYHDMGLISGIILPLYESYPSILISPILFARVPLKWIEIISQEKATISQAPNFAYALCADALQRNKEVLNIDLTSWKAAYNGAEPIKYSTMNYFYNCFKQYGFDKNAFCPAYGMAEATLHIASSRPQSPVIVKTVDKIAFETKGEIIQAFLDKEDDVKKTVSLVSSGVCCEEHEVIIVDPKTRINIGTNKVGEIWVRGPSVTLGYWNKPELTHEQFNVSLNEGNGLYLRTGDLGFIDVEGEIFVTGRIKDLIILNGRNIYPQDVEQTVSSSHLFLVANACIVFATDIGGKENIVVVQEVKGNAKEYSDIFRNIISELQLEHQLTPFDILLIRETTISKTSSNKLQRALCKQKYISGELTIVASWKETFKTNVLPSLLEEKTEKILYKIWSELLSLPQSTFDPTSDFFKFGGQSITMIMLVAKIRSELKINITIDEIIKNSTLEQQIELIKNKTASCESTELIDRVNQYHIYPVIWHQKVHIFHDIARKGTNIPQRKSRHIIKYVNNIDIAKFYQAWVSVLESYPALNVQFDTSNNLVKIEDNIKVDFRSYDLSTESLDMQDQSIRKILQCDQNEDYDLEKGKLHRVYLVKHQDNLYSFILSHHNILFDGWSSGIILDVLHNAYLLLISGKSVSTGKDFAYSHAQHYLSATKNIESKFWSEKIAKLPLRSSIDFLKKTTNVANTGKEYKVVCLDGEDFNSLRRIFSETSLTHSTILLYALHKSLHVASNADVTVIGIMVSGRILPIEFIEKSVGLYTNILPMVVEHQQKNDLCLYEALKLYKTSIMEINTRSNIDLSDLLVDQREPFEIYFNYHNYPGFDKKKYNNKLNFSHISSSDPLQYPLEFSVYDLQDSVKIYVDYNPQLLDSPQLESFLSIYKRIILDIVQHLTRTRE